MTPQKRAWLQLLLLCVAVFSVSFAIRHLLLPDVVPVGFAEEAQPLWAVQLAFLLRALEQMAGLGGLMLLIAAFGALVGTQRRARRLSHDLVRKPDATFRDHAMTHPDP